MADPILKHFELTDKQMAKLFRDAQLSSTALEILKPKPVSQYAEELFSSIVSQQLSTKAAATIWRRFADLVGDPSHPEIVKNFDIESLRTIGLSRQKASYILDIAKGTSDGTVRLDHLDELDDDAVITELIQLKGVGRWTAEMFLIFTLGREDVFSIGDLGLRNAANKLYNRELSLTDLTELSQKWSPYRSTASLLLWHSLDNKPTN